MDAGFDYLTGLVKVPAPAPKEWKKEGLGKFYYKPNDEKWGASLCRVLYHESIHFWQFLSSGYVANLVAEDWKRLNHFRDTGEIKPVSPLMQCHTVRAKGLPFSPRELVECWARYWDIHTRGPHNIIRQDGLLPEETIKLDIAVPYSDIKAYTHEAYDYLMQKGPYSIVYGAPYRWLLEQTNGHSAFVAITFPILAHSAFGSPDPAGVFCESFTRAWNSKKFKEKLQTKSGSINLDWLNYWSGIISGAHIPVIERRKLPRFTSGLDVINRGALKSHPIYPVYAIQFLILRSRLSSYNEKFTSGEKPSDIKSLLQYALADLPMKDPWVVFGLPGQNDYRYYLGTTFEPPGVQFENYTLYKQLTVPGDKESIGSYASIMEELVPLVEKFRNAERAVEKIISEGLPANAFE